MEDYKTSAIMISKNKNAFVSAIYESTYKCGINISLANSFSELLMLIQSGHFQILIIDAETSSYDDSIFELFSHNGYYVPHIVVAYNQTNPVFQTENKQIIFSKYEDVPFALSKLADINCITRLPLNKSFQLSEDKQKEIRHFMLEIGLCTKYRGFDYIFETAKIMLTNDTAKSLNRSIYPVVASKYFTSCSAVERNIRHALSSCWQTSNKLKNTFSDFYKDQKAPSNRFVLCSLKQLLKERLNMA